MTRCSVALPLAAVVAGLVPLDAAAQSQAAARRSSPWRDVQGFNVVLLVGESERSGGATMELPGGARKALTDMREFLPYRHYRVLDSQWLSCCSHDVRLSPMTGRLQGVVATTNVRSGARGTSVDMGLAPRTFAFTLWLMESSDATRMPVKFTLRDDVGRSSGQGTAVTAREVRVSELRTEMEMLQIQIEAARRRVNAGTMPQDELRTLEARLASTERRLSEAARGGGGSGSVAAAHHTPVLDTSFMMEVGETVVVGTSRLGGDKALIALVTAVRRSGSSR